MLAQQDLAWAAEWPWTSVLAGLVVLVVGADLLVRGAVWIALILGMSRMAVGLTLVAIGTSLPELLVTVTAAKTGQHAMAFANVLGSNAANTMFIVGAAATICAIRLHVRWLELGWSLVATAVLALPFVLDMGIERSLSAVMLAMLALFCTHLLLRERGRAVDAQEHRPRATARGWTLHLGLIVAGSFGLNYGAEWLVGGGTAIGESMGLSEVLIGLLAGVATSFPELATSAIAALRKQPEICIGNVLGSNIFNVGAVLGIGGMVQPFPVEHSEQLNNMFVVAISAVVLVTILRGMRGVPRPVGILFLLSFFSFLGWVAYYPA